MLIRIRAIVLGNFIRLKLDGFDIVFCDCFSMLSFYFCLICIKNRIPVSCIGSCLRNFQAAAGCSIRPFYYTTGNAIQHIFIIFPCTIGNHNLTCTNVASPYRRII